VILQKQSVGDQLHMAAVSFRDDQKLIEFRVGERFSLDMKIDVSGNIRDH
jgi:hypothetical protein